MSFKVKADFDKEGQDKFVVASRGRLNMNTSFAQIFTGNMIVTLNASTANIMFLEKNCQFSFDFWWWG